MKKALVKLKDILPEVKVRMSSLTSKEVLVGVPQDKTTRKEDGMTNAALAYIHDNGSPAGNIPARPFMRPGIAEAKSEVIRRMKQGAAKILRGEEGAEDATLMAVGLAAQAKIRAAINAGIPPALADSTLRARIRNRKGVKGARAELASRKAGNLPSLTLAKPLVNTGQLRNSINFVIRGKK